MIRPAAPASFRRGRPDLDPVLVVLLLGVTTDYTVFFLDGMRARVAGGVPRVRAARLATAEFAPIILAAGVIVAAAAASLAVARTKLLSAFGPGLALTVLTAMAVSMTLGPACARQNSGGPARRRAPHRAADRRGGHRRAARGRLGRSLYPPRITADQGASSVVTGRSRGHRRGGRLRTRHLVPDRDPGHRPGPPGCRTRGSSWPARPR